MKHTRTLVARRTAPVGRNCPDLGHLLLCGDRLADVREHGNHVVRRELDALPQVHWVHARRHRLKNITRKRERKRGHVYITTRVLQDEGVSGGVRDSGWGERPQQYGVLSWSSGMNLFS